MSVPAPVNAVWWCWEIWFIEWCQLGNKDADLL